jgi:hypothetical protein
MKHKRTRQAITYQAEKVFGLTRKTKSLKWTNEDMKTLEEIIKLQDITGRKLSNTQIKDIYNIITGQDRSDYSISERKSMIEDPNFTFDATAKVNNRGKKVLCVELNKVYDSVKQAAEDLQIPVYNIRCFLGPNKHRNSARGYTFKYIEA